MRIHNFCGCVCGVVVFAVLGFVFLFVVLFVCFVFFFKVRGGRVEICSGDQSSNLF